MGRWRAAASLLLSRVAAAGAYKSSVPAKPPFHLHRPSASTSFHFRFLNSRPFSAIPSRVSVEANDYDSEPPCYAQSQSQAKEDEETGKIPVKAYFLCTSINLKSMQAENLSNVIPPSSRSSNYIALRFCENTEFGVWRYMVVFQYGSAVLFNVEDHEVDAYLDLVTRHASGLLPEMRKDGKFL
ncbi:hypothetical protein ACFXTH_021010 [Malus domestica]